MNLAGFSSMLPAWMNPLLIPSLAMRKGEAFYEEVKTWLNDDAYPEMADISGIISDIMR